MASKDNGRNRDNGVKELVWKRIGMNAEMKAANKEGLFFLVICLAMMKIKKGIRESKMLGRSLATRSNGKNRSNEAER